MRKFIPAIFLIIIFSLILTQTKSVYAQRLPGDADNDGDVDILDFAKLAANWGKNLTGPDNADFNNNGVIEIIDFGILAANWGRTSGTPTPTPTQSAAGWLDQTVCYPQNGPFSLTINNEWLPFPVGMVHVLEAGGLRVQISVLNQTEVVAGVTTRVVEEREWQNGSLVEVSHNWFVQSPSGTVCYYGEDVRDGNGNPLGGSWRVGVGGARAGIMMPPQPVVGMKWLIEDAAPIAFEDALVQSIGQSFVTPFKTFPNTLYIIEDAGRSFKRYAPGVGMIYDDGIRLTSCLNNIACGQ